ncbi:MAG: rod shape-determining protein MreD [Desulfotomaculales bacterium]
MPPARRAGENGVKTKGMQPKILGAFALVAFLQVTVLDAIGIFGLKPDLVVVLVIFYGFLFGQREGAFWGFVGGFLLDMATGSYFGLNVLDHLVAGYLAGVVQGALYKDNPFVVSLTTLLVCFFSGFLHYLLLLYLGITVSPGVALFRIAFLAALYNAAVALILFRWFFRAYKRSLPVSF